MRRLTIPIVLAPAFIVGCAARPNKPVGTAGTLAELRNVRPDVQEVKVEQGLDQAMQQYRRFLEEAPETAMTPEAMRRLADLQLEKQFGIRTGDAKPREMAAPQARPGTRELAGRHVPIRPRLPARACRNPIRISSGARPRRPESWRAVTPRLAGGRGARWRRSQGSTRGDRSLRSAAHRVPELQATATRSSIRWRGRTTNSAAPKRPSRPWSA